MTAALTRPARIRFDWPQFYNAMVELLGREPDLRVRRGLDGFFSNIYKPKDDAERKKFADLVHPLRLLLDKYDITFSETYCEYTKEDLNFGEVLRVTIKHPVTARTTREADALHCNIR